MLLHYESFCFTVDSYSSYGNLFNIDFTLVNFLAPLIAMSSNMDRVTSSQVKIRVLDLT